MDDYIKKTIDTYEKTADRYIENVKELLPIREFEKFINYVPSGNILDIGCGSGVAAKNLQAKRLQVYGIDLSKKLLEASKTESPKSVFYEMDMRDLKFPNNYFDGIWQMASLLHLKKSDTPIALSEAYRVLKPEGVIYVPVKMGEGEGIEEDTRYDNLPKFYAYYSQEEINKIIQNVGFEVLENYSIGYKDQYRKNHPWINLFAKK